MTYVKMGGKLYSLPRHDYKHYEAPTNKLAIAGTVLFCMAVWVLVICAATGVLSLE